MAPSRLRCAPRMVTASEVCDPEWMLQEAALRDAGRRTAREVLALGDLNPEKLDRRCVGHGVGLLEDARRHPSREWRLRNHVVSLRSVLFGHFRNTVRAEAGRQPDERWPQPPVHVSHLPANQSADEDVLRVPQLPRHAPDLLCLGMSPPIASDLLARDFRRKAGHRALRRLEHDPSLLDKCQSVFNRQCSRPSKFGPPSVVHAEQDATDQH